MLKEDHEDLGHNHVAHLDLLNRQQGHHSHSSSKEGHSHGHGHGHDHPQHKPDSHHPHREQDLIQCSKQTTAASPAAGAPAGHDHNHGHDAESNHEHPKVGSDHKHDDGHVQDTHDRTHENEHKNGQVQVQSNHKNQSAQHHSDHDHNEVQTGTDYVPVNREKQPSLQLEPSPVPQELPSFPSTTESQPKKQRKPARVRGQRGRNRTAYPLTPLSDDHDHQSNHGHKDHDRNLKDAQKKKREAPGGHSAPTLLATDMPGHPGGLSHQHHEVGLVLNSSDVSFDPCQAPFQELVFHVRK